MKKAILWILLAGAIFALFSTVMTESLTTDTLQDQGTFNTITEYNSWTANEVDSDGSFSHDAVQYKDGGGSLAGTTKVVRKADWDGEYLSKTTTLIESGSEALLNWSWRKTYVFAVPERQDMTIELIKPDGSSVNIWTNSSPVWDTWTDESLDISNNIDQTGNYEIRLGCSLKNGNAKTPQTTCWFDEVSLHVAEINYGTLNVTMNAPTDNLEISQYDEFTINATVTCEGEPGAVCGTVSANARYNEGLNPDTPISETETVPFYIDSNCIGTGNYTYDNWNFDIEDGEPRDIAFDGTSFWIAGRTTTKVYKYTLEGSYDNFSFDVGNEETSPTGLHFDGENFWIVGYDSGKVHKYDSNGNYENWSFDVTAEDSEPTSVFFNGTNFWVIGKSTATIYRYDSNGNYDGWNFYTGNEATHPTGIHYDGEKFLVVGYSKNTIYRYTAEGIYDNWFIDASSQDVKQTGVTTDGTHIWTVGKYNSKVYRYAETCSTGTGNYVHDGWSFSVSNNPRDITFNGTNFWTVDQDTDSVHKYGSEGTYIDSFSVGTYQTTPVGLTLYNNKLWVIGYDTDSVYKYDISGNYENWNFYAGNQEDEPTGVFFNGTNFWVVGRTTNSVYRYDINGNYDGWNFYVGNELVSPSGIYFNGTNFWISDRVNGAVYRYDASGNYDNWAIDTSSEDNSITGVFFNGTYFWITGRDSDKILRYAEEIAAANPQTAQETLEQGESWNVNWTVNATGIGDYKIDVLFNSSYANVQDNDTTDSNVNIAIPEVSCLTPDGTECDDGLFCTTNDVCISGICSGETKSCSDGITCTTDSCNELVDACVNQTDNSFCDDGLYCNGTETCNAISGCQAGIVVNCNDSEECTTDSCNETLEACEYISSADETACTNGVCCSGTCMDGATTCSLSPVKCWNAEYQYLYTNKNQARKFCKCSQGVYGYNSYSTISERQTSYRYIDSADNESWEIAIKSSSPIYEVTCTDSIAYQVNQDYYYPK